MAGLHNSALIILGAGTGLNQLRVPVLTSALSLAEPRATFPVDPQAGEVSSLSWRIFRPKADFLNDKRTLITSPPRCSEASLLVTQVRRLFASGDAN